MDKIVLQNNLQVNVGVVKFSLDVTRSSSSLTSLNSGTLSTIKSYFSPAFISGSNMYGGILAGRKLLETGSAQAENKYLIVASDFGGYKSDAGDGKRLSFFYKYSYVSNGVTEAIHNNSDFHSRYYYTQTSNTKNSVFTVSAVDNLINNKIFFTGVGVSAETDKYLTETGFPGWRVS